MTELNMITLYRLASDNNLTFSEFVKKIEKEYTVDTSNYPKNEDGDIIYPDGKIGISLNFDHDEELELHELASAEGVSTNQFIENASQFAIDKREKQ